MAAIRGFEKGITSVEKVGTSERVNHYQYYSSFITAGIWVIKSLPKPNYHPTINFINLHIFTGVTYLKSISSPTLKQ